MDKSVILAVAGAGKTSLIVEKLNLEERFLLITYTINNTRNLKESIIKKFGFFPENIDLFTYYHFLYTFCFRPFLSYKLRPKGIFWNTPPISTNKIPLTNINRFMTKERLLYHNRIAKLLEYCNVIDEINERLSKYYDCLFIDEVQDFAGHDFNLLKNICKSKIEILLVGDFYQHTFDTSRDGNTNAKIHSDFNKYQELFKKIKIIPDSESLNKSYRCTKSVCDFISNKIGIKIQSHKETHGTVLFLESDEEIKNVLDNDNIIKLFYREHYKYDCFSRNWGDCKGENHYHDVCVVLNKTTMLSYTKDSLEDLKPITKNKFYVACSRAHNNLYLIEEDKVKSLRG